MQSSHLDKRGKGLVFIVEINSRKICEVTPEVIAGNNNLNPIGKKLDEIIFIENNIGTKSIPAFFDNQWYKLEQEILIWKDRPCLKIGLRKRTNMPDSDVITSLKKMLEVLLHRLRSPLTGIQGYTYLVKNNVGDTYPSNHIDQINKGINHIFNLLDELEQLQKIPSKPVNPNNFSASFNGVINQILSNYSNDITDRIEFSAPHVNHIVQCNHRDLRRILSQLLDNAIRYSDVETDQITIDSPSPNSIRISHNGPPMPTSIEEELFSPFVTSGAQSLGIGLTIALLYAQRYNGSIYLAENSHYKGVSFVLCFPPTSNWNALGSSPHLIL